MKKMIVMLLCVLFSGCALLNRAETIAVAPHFHKLEHDTFAIFPFSLATKGLDRELGFSVSDVMTDAFETALLENGYQVVERNKISRVTREMAFSYSGDVDPEQLKDIGKLTNSNVLVLGLVRAFKPPVFGDKERPDKVTECTTISFSVKAIHIETGELLWKGALTKTSGLTSDFFYSCDYNIFKYADKVSRDMVKKIRAQIEDLSPESGAESEESRGEVR